MIQEEEAEQKKRSTILIICGVVITIIVCIFYFATQIITENVQEDTDDLKRKEDVATVVSQLSAYQSNNNGRLPTNENSFALYYLADVVADPDGTLYDFTINTLESNETKEVSTFDHTMYILYHAKCKNGAAVYATSVRDYVVLYRLKDKTTYCLSR